MLKIPRIAKYILLVFALCYLDTRVTTETGQNDFIPYLRTQLGKIQTFGILSIHYAVKSLEMLNQLLIRPPLSTTHKRIEQNFALSSSGAKLVEQRGGIYSGAGCLSKSKDQYTSFVCSPKNMRAKSLTIGLAEDALVEKVELYFFESFSARVKSFTIWLSLDGHDLSWVNGGKHIAEEKSKKQIFTLPKASVARRVKITFHDSYDSPYHYCTISQIVVNGKTYSSYAAQQTKKFLTEELIKNINNEFEKDQIMIEEVFEKQNESSQSLIVDLKTQFQSYVYEKNDETLKKKFLNKRTTCSQFEDMFMFVYQQCSPNDYLTKMMGGDGGPLESYFQVMDIKIKVIL